MEKSIRIYQQFNGKETLVALWNDCPAFFLKWFSQTFGEGKSNAISGNFDSRKDDFFNFLMACGDARVQHSDFPIRKFFDLKYDEEIDESYVDSCVQILYDSNNITQRKLDHNLIWRIKEDAPGEIENKSGIFQGKFLRFRKHTRDSGHGAAERWEHDAQYFVFAEFNIFGFPVSVDSRLRIELRDLLLKQNGCQRISENLLANLEKKNEGRKIQAEIGYKYNDEWPWDLFFVNPLDVIAQLDLT